MAAASDAHSAGAAAAMALGLDDAWLDALGDLGELGALLLGTDAPLLGGCALAAARCGAGEHATSPAAARDAPAAPPLGAAAPATASAATLAAEPAGCAVPPGEGARGEDAAAPTCSTHDDTGVAASAEQLRCLDPRHTAACTR